MANRDRREALRGAEEETFDLFAEVWTTDQWSEMLKAPLQRAAGQGNRGLAQRLVRAGAEIGDALHEAARGGHGDVVSDLLENGASVDAKDTSDDGSTPLHIAAKERETEIVQLLLLKGADKDALNNYECTPLHLAVLNNHVAAALALMAAGADVTIGGGQYRPPVLHLAAARGLVDILRAAIERGADVEAVDEDQRTPLHDAAIDNRVKTINVLLEAGANIKARNRYGCTPLHHAAQYSSHAAVLALLKHRADANAQDEDQGTPLHYAAGGAGIQGAAEVVDALLRSGADETILNDEGKAAAAVVGSYLDEDEDELTEDADRVRELLANAPADRAWRRRGYLVLCRAHPDRVGAVQQRSGACAGLARITHSSAKQARTETSSCAGTAQATPVEGQVGGDWAVVVARVLALQQEGIFRTIVGYL